MMISEAGPSALAAHMAHKARINRILSKAIPEPPRPVYCLQTEPIPDPSAPDDRFPLMGSIWIDLSQAIIQPVEAQVHPSIASIQKIVAARYNQRIIDLISARRTGDAVRPRQIAVYLARVLTLRSLPEIGRAFGGRDHTTILHSIRKIEYLILHDATMAQEISEIDAEIRARCIRARCT